MVAGVMALAAAIGGACTTATSTDPDPRWCNSIDRWTGHRLVSSADPLEGFSLANDELDRLRELPQPGAIRQDMEVFLGIDENLENVDARTREAHRLDRIGRYVRTACPDIPERQIQVFSWSDPVIGEG